MKEVHCLIKGIRKGLGRGIESGSTPLILRAHLHGSLSGHVTR